MKYVVYVVKNLENKYVHFVEEVSNSYIQIV